MRTRPLAAVTSAATRRPSVCHPDRRADLGGLCLECALDKKAAREGEVRVRLEGFPERIPGVEQRALSRVPSRCPKCKGPHLRLEGRTIRCPGALAGCGGTWVLIA